ncbi:hypothetical protein [Streptomyces litmocidini]|uniref:hypothetical protein n=1 Tax=Streptomyces litmocidini TaxID=67318 RepID=UPI0036F7D042
MPAAFGKDAGRNGSHPFLKAAFGVAGPGGTGLVIRTGKTWPNSMVFNLALGAGELKPGGYRFRPRALGGDQASDRTPWCGFTVTR